MFCITWFAPPHTLFLIPIPKPRESAIPRTSSKMLDWEKVSEQQKNQEMRGSIGFDGGGGERRPCPKAFARASNHDFCAFENEKAEIGLSSASTQHDAEEEESCTGATIDDVLASQTPDRGPGRTGVVRSPKTPDPNNIREEKKKDVGSAE